jgi:hypothetical protein
MSRYANGQPIYLTTTVKDRTGTLVDAGALSLTVQKPDLTQQTYSSPTHDSTGTYHQDIPAADLSQNGHYQYVWTSTGTGAGISRGEFDVFDPFEVSLISLQDAKDALNISQTDTTSDTEIMVYLSTIESNLEMISGGPIVTRTVSNEMVQVQHDYRYLILRQRPVQAVTSIVNVYSAAAISLADVVVEPNSGIVSRKLGLPFLTLFTPWFYVTYTAGWGTAVPAAFNAAARIILQHLWSTQRGPGQSPIPRMDETFLPGMAFAIPNRAAELLRPYTQEAYV